MALPNFAIAFVTFVFAATVFPAGAKYSDLLRMLGPCEKAGLEVLEEHRGEAEWIPPSCTPDGYWEVVQEEFGVGKYCVQPITGERAEEIPTIKWGKAGEPECPPCYKEQQKWLRRVMFAHDYWPRCDERGWFISKQKHGILHFCVNKTTGHKITEPTKEEMWWCPGDEISDHPLIKWVVTGLALLPVVILIAAFLKK